MHPSSPALMGLHTMSPGFRTSSPPPLFPNFTPVLSPCAHIARVAFSSASFDEKSSRTKFPCNAETGHGFSLSNKKVLSGFIFGMFPGNRYFYLKDADQVKKRWHLYTVASGLIHFPAEMSFNSCAYAANEIDNVNAIYGDLGAGLEIGIQVLYLAALLGLVGVGTFFVVRQLLVRRELESAAKELQDRVRTGEASSVEYFELGAIMLRKKFFVLASKYLQQAIEKWDGDPEDLAQVHNALGFSFVNDGKIDKGIAEYEKAVKLQPGYVVAWNNLGNAYEKKKNLPKALKAYDEALSFDPDNSVAKEYGDAIRQKLNRLAGVPVKYD